jgi:hypothetical protein
MINVCDIYKMQIVIFAILIFGATVFGILAYIKYREASKLSKMYDGLIWDMFSKAKVQVIHVSEEALEKINTAIKEGKLVNTSGEKHEQN